MERAQVVVCVRAEGDWTVVELAGELDLLTASQLRALVDQLIHQGHHRLIIELAQVSFLDSAGLGVLLHAWRMVRPHGGLRLAGVHDQIWSKLHSTGLWTVLPSYSSVAEAARQRATPIG